MAHLKYLWAILLLGGNVLGFLLALTNLYISRGDRRIAIYYSEIPNSKEKVVINEKHRYGISMYFYYPITIYLISIFAFVTLNYEGLISDIESFAGYTLLVAIILTVFVVGVFSSCVIMILIEHMMDFFIRTHYKRKYGVIVTKDPRYFNIEDESAQIKSPE